MEGNRNIYFEMTFFFLYLGRVITLCFCSVGKQGVYLELKYQVLNEVLL